MSCHGPADGFCAMDVVLGGWQLSARASGGQISSAATELLNTCALNHRGRGGIVTGVGKYFMLQSPLPFVLCSKANAYYIAGIFGSLHITMQSYDPSHIQCGAFAHPPFQDGCSRMAAGITASDEDRIFGKGGEPGVQESLPANFMTPSMCMTRTPSSTSQIVDRRRSGKLCGRHPGYRS